MKKTTIILSISFISLALLFLFTFLSFQHGGRSWLIDQGSTLTESCKKVLVGDSVESVTEKMGIPDSQLAHDGLTTLLYMRGGLISDQGISFDFKGGKLIKANCR